MTGEAASAHERAASWLACERWLAFAIAVLAALCYANGASGDFVFDDIRLIVNNDIVKDPGRVSELLFTNLWGLVGRESNYYRPLPPLAFMLLHAVFGLRPEPFHLLNIGLHAAASSLVFLIGLALLTSARIDRARATWPAFAGAALFAVHPIHAEAVSWISGMMDVSCAAFSLLAIYLYVTRSDGAHWQRRELLSAGALSLALLSKEPAAVVPFVLVAYDLLFERNRLGNVRAALRRWAPGFTVLVVYLCVRAYAIGGFAPVRPAQTASAVDLVLTVPRLLALYLQKLVVPVALNVLYDVKPIAAVTSRELVWTVVVLGLFGGIAWLALRTGRAAAFGLVLLVAALAPALAVPALSQQLSQAFAERYAYLPSAGQAILVAAGLASLADRDRRLYGAALGALAALLLSFAGMAVERNRVWKDSISLWTDTVRKSPDVGVAHENMGLALIRRGRECEGRRELRAAARLAPELPRTALASGVLAARRGLLLQGILSLQTALVYEPELAEARFNLALALEQLGWIDAAIREYRATVAQDNGHADAHNNLGILLAQRNGLDEAIDHFKAAIRSRPRDPELRLNLARAFEMKGLAKEATEQRSLAAAGDAAPPAMSSVHDASDR